MLSVIWLICWVAFPMYKACYDSDMWTVREMQKISVIYTDAWISKLSCILWW